MSELIIRGTSYDHNHLAKVPEIEAIESKTGESFHIALSGIAQGCRERCKANVCGFGYRADQQQAATSRIVDGAMVTYSGPVTVTIAARCDQEGCPTPDAPDTFVSQVEHLYTN